VTANVAKTSPSKRRAVTNELYPTTTGFVRYSPSVLAAKLFNQLTRTLHGPAGFRAMTPTVGRGHCVVGWPARPRLGAVGSQSGTTTDPMTSSFASSRGWRCKEAPARWPRSPQRFSACCPVRPRALAGTPRKPARPVAGPRPGTANTAEEPSQVRASPASRRKFRMSRAMFSERMRVPSWSFCATPGPADP